MLIRKAVYHGVLVSMMPYGVEQAYHGGADGIEIVMEGIVAIHDIRLHESLVLNMDLGENEVRLKPEAAVEITAAWDNTGQPTHSHIVGRSFGAAVPLEPLSALTMGF